MSSLKELQLKLIECPVCYEALKPPVTTCVNGHGICDNCRSMIDICAICKGDFSEVKNTLLNQMIECVAFECKYSANGCKERSPINDVKEHEKLCNYKLEKCCVCSKNDIPSLKLNDHLETHEKPKSCVTFNQTFSIVLNCVKSRDKYFNYVMAFIKNIEKHFLVRIKIHLKEKCILLIVQYTGKKEEAKNYVFSVRINQDPSSHKPCYFICNGICAPYFHELKEVDSHPRTVKLDFKSIFLNDNYSLSQLKILMEINGK